MSVFKKNTFMHLPQVIGVMESLLFGETESVFTDLGGFAWRRAQISVQNTLSFDDITIYGSIKMKAIQRNTFQYIHWIGGDVWYTVAHIIEISSV